MPIKRTKASKEDNSSNRGATVFDFTSDVKVIDARSKLFSGADNQDGIAKRKNTKDKKDISTFSCEFMTASGRPVEREVLKVLASELVTDTKNEDDNDPNARTHHLGYPKYIPPQKQLNQVLQKSSNFQSNKSLGNECQPRDSWKNDQRLKHFEEKIIDLVEAEIISKQIDIDWKSIAGLEKIKTALKEIVVLPFLRPDIFTGIRAPPKGVLLFGPPGTGKTLLARCVASLCKATFFNIAASSITSKWIGEGEKLVRALFSVASILQPSIIFIDEVDSLLTSRSEGEHESSRRIKTEFFINMDGLGSSSDDRVLILGATNRPHELDDAAKRRFVKRLYIGLPCEEARAQIVRSLIHDQRHELIEDEFSRIAAMTEGYSGADMRHLCSEAAMGPIRDIVQSSLSAITTVHKDEVRPISLDDFEKAFVTVRPTVVNDDLNLYINWNIQYGSVQL